MYINIYASYIYIYIYIYAYIYIYIYIYYSKYFALNAIENFFSCTKK